MAWLPGDKHKKRGSQKSQWQIEKAERDRQQAKVHRELNERALKNHPFKVDDVNRILNVPEHEKISHRAAMLASINEEAQKTTKIVKVWTDGSCLNSGQPNSSGGWACHLASTLSDGTPYVKEYYGGELQTTNNRMELLAVYHALSKLRNHRKVIIRTDSKYLQNGLCSWIHTWKKNGWRTANGDPVKNKDLWVDISELLSKHTVCFLWVKGHAGEKINNRMDMLAKEARMKVLDGSLEPRRCHAVM